jgi:lysozyme
VTLDRPFLDKIKGFEGYNSKPYWDYKQWTSGYGTRAAGPDEAIDQAEAERRLQAEIGKAGALVDQFAPNLDPGTRAALTSLTYNAGGKWMESGLGQAVKAGDPAAIRERFTQYTKAGGQTLPGLVNRRNTEAEWIGGGTPAGSSSPMPFSLATPVTQADPAVTPAAAPAAVAGLSLPFGLSLGKPDKDQPDPLAGLEGMQPGSPLKGLRQRQPMDMSQLMQLASIKRGGIR